MLALPRVCVRAGGRACAADQSGLTVKLNSNLRPKPPPIAKMGRRRRNTNRQARKKPKKEDAEAAAASQKEGELAARSTVATAVVPCPLMQFLSQPEAGKTWLEMAARETSFLRRRRRGCQRQRQSGCSDNRDGEQLRIDAEVTVHEESG